MQPSWFEYQPASPSMQAIRFNNGLYAGTAENLRGWKYEYTTSHADISGVSMAGREITIPLLSHLDRSLIDRLRRVSAFDVTQRTPGTLVADTGWRIKAYITKCAISSITKHTLTAEITVVLVDGVWMREGERVQCAVHTASGDQWLDLPTNLPFDLQAPRMSSRVVNPMLSACDWRMTLYGPAHNPRVRIAGNDYMLDVLIPQGGYVLVDQHERTIQLTAPNGDVSNVLGSAHRGSGLGSGQYIFEPIPAGASTIEWDGSFGFDLTPILLEVELPWSM